MVRQSWGFATVHPYECKQNGANTCESITNKANRFHPWLFKISWRIKVTASKHRMRCVLVSFVIRSQAFAKFTRVFVSILNIRKGFTRNSANWFAILVTISKTSFVSVILLANLINFLWIFREYIFFYIRKDIHHCVLHTWNKYHWQRKPRKGIINSCPMQSQWQRNIRIYLFSAKLQPPVSHSCIWLLAVMCRRVLFLVVKALLEFATFSAMQKFLRKRRDRVK